MAAAAASVSVRQETLRYPIKSLSPAQVALPPCSVGLASLIRLPSSVGETLQPRGPGAPLRHGGGGPSSPQRREQRPASPNQRRGWSSRRIKRVCCCSCRCCCCCCTGCSCWKHLSLGCMAGNYQEATAPRLPSRPCCEQVGGPLQSLGRNSGGS